MYIVAFRTIFKINYFLIVIIIIILQLINNRKNRIYCNIYYKKIKIGINIIIYN